VLKPLLLSNTKHTLLDFFQFRSGLGIVQYSLRNCSQESAMPTIHPVSFQVYLSRREKAIFKNICYQLDTDMSREVRRMIRDFIKNPPVQHFIPLAPLEFNE
jgi:hypothetical protein